MRVVLRNLILLGITQIVGNYKIYDEDPVIRARQLVAKTDQQFVEKQIENLIAVAIEPTLETLRRGPNGDRSSY